MSTGSEQREKLISFHPEQLKYLEKLFPEIIHKPSSTPAEMYYHSGARRVLQTIRDKVK